MVFTMASLDAGSPAAGQQLRLADENGKGR
jgi:hypothetical protein